MGSIPSPAQWVKGPDISVAVALVPAAAQSQSLARKLPYAVGVAIKKKPKISANLNPEAHRTRTVPSTLEGGLLGCGTGHLGLNLGFSKLQSLFSLVLLAP